MVTFIYVIRSLIKCIWSIYMRYGYYFIAIMNYFIINHRVVCYIRDIYGHFIQK